MAFKDLDAYRESFGEVDKYMAEWRTSWPWIASGNKLRGISLASASKLDPEYSDLSILTDGKAGFASDYHTGWLLNSGDQLQLTIPKGTLSGDCQLKLTFMQAPQWHIFAPSAVEVWQNGKLVGKASPAATDGKQDVKVAATGLKNSAPVELRVSKAACSGRATIALTEVEAL